MSRRTRRRLRRARPLLLVVVVASGLLLLGGAIIAVQGWQARHDLIEARGALQRARTAVADGDSLAARGALHDAQVRSHRASGRLFRGLWSGYARLPVVGASVRETRGLIDVTNDVSTQVLAPLVSAAPSSSRWTGRADVAGLRRTAGPLRIADDSLTTARQRLAGLPFSRVQPLDRARAQLAEALDALAVDVRDAAVAAQTLPSLLGADRPTRILVVAQNLAEERATGGLVGSFALVSADDGSLSLLRSGTDAELVDASKPVVNLGADFQARYGRAESASTWRSANLTPDVPSAGAILAGLCRRQLGVPVDAVVFVDPVALSDVLGATGPVRVPGLGPVSSGNATSLLLRDVYGRFPSVKEQPQRKEAMRQAFDAVIQRLERPVTGKLVRQLAKAVSSGHLRVFATEPSLQAELTHSRVSGELPRGGPLLLVVTQDVGGSKLDYYLGRSVSYVAAPSSVAVDLGSGPETVENGKITVTLHSTAPSRGLPPYVTVRADDPGAHPVGQLKTWLSIYLGPRSTYSAASLDGRPLKISSGVESGLTVLSAFVTVNPGSSSTLVLDVQQPASPDTPLLWLQQPRLQPDVLVVRRARSAGYAAMYDAS